MNRSSIILTAVLGMACAAPLAYTWAEVAIDPETIRPADVQVETLHEGPVSLECWQQGNRIFGRDDLRGLSIEAASRNDTVSFKRQGEKDPSVFLLEVANAICIVEPVNSSAAQ